MGFKTVLELADSPPTAKASFKSVVDFAEDVTAAGSQAVRQASDTVEGAVNDISGTVSDVVSEVSQALPDATGVKDTLSSVGSSVREAIGNTAEAIAGPQTAVKALKFLAPIANKVAPINAAKFAEFLSNDGKINITSEDLGEDYDFLREKAIEAIQSGKGKFDYGTWGFTDKTVLMQDLGSTVTGSFTDPNVRMATLIGRTGNGNVRIENGRVIVEDVYDFNTGPRGTKLQKALVLKETGDIEGYEKLAEEALGDQTYFGQMRIWGAALGVPQGEGTRFKLDLGPAPE